MDRESLSGGASRLLFFGYLGMMTLLAGAIVRPVAACETARDGGAEAVWTLRVEEEQPWTLPESCTAALDDLAARMAALAGRRRRDVVSIEVLLHGGRPTSLLLARMSALANRIEASLIERGVRKHRIRLRDLRMPGPVAGEIADASRIIVRIGEP